LDLDRHAAAIKSKRRELGCIAVAISRLHDPRPGGS
jgi:hypothetical protein